jgi:ribosomal protein L6P/L9E
MDNQQTRRINEAARTFAEAIRESLRITSERSEEARERANRLTRNFFESVTSELQAEAERNRTASQQLIEQSQKQQAAFRQMSEESMTLYRDFLGSISSYYQANMEQGRRNVQEGARTATQATERAASSVQDATERTSTSVQAASEGHSGVPIEGYDELNVGQVASRLDGLSRTELQNVREYEVQNKNRQTLLDQIDQKLA